MEIHTGIFGIGGKIVLEHIMELVGICHFLV